MSQNDRVKRSRPTNDRSSSISDDDRKVIDRKKFNQLSEREREAELLKLYEEREQRNHHEEIRQRLESKRKNDDTKQTMEFDKEIYSQDDDDDRPSNYRRQQINASKHKETERARTLQVLAEQRKKIQSSTSSKTKTFVSNDDRSLCSSDDQMKKSAKLKVNDVYSSESSDDERSRSPITKSEQKKTMEISTKLQLKGMMLTRYRIEKWCHAPFFAELAKGAFVRINIGQNSSGSVYRICEILQVVRTGKIYKLGSTKTNKGLRLRHGDHERVFRLEFVSNREISDSEFKKWREALRKKRIALPTVEQFERKSKEIESFKKKILNNQEIDEIVAEKERYREAPINFAMKKCDLLKEIDKAQEEKDLTKETQLKKQLDEIKKRAEELDEKRTENISKIAFINQRNRKTTQENVESALVRQALEKHDQGADPFTRRRCAPTLFSRAPQTREELLRELKNRRAAEEAAKIKRDEQRTMEKKSNQTESTLDVIDLHLKKINSSNNGAPMLRTHERGSFAPTLNRTDELFRSHDFELDVPIQILPK